VSVNNENSNLTLPGRLGFTFRADYFFDGSDDGSSEIFDYDNLRNDRIMQIAGWAVTDAGLGGQDDNATINPGVYLSVTIGERHGISILIPEQELLKILSEIQRLKDDFEYHMEYVDAACAKDAAKGNVWESEWE